MNDFVCNFIFSYHVMMILLESLWRQALSNYMPELNLKNNEKWKILKNEKEILTTKARKTQKNSVNAIKKSIGEKKNTGVSFPGT